MAKYRAQASGSGTAQVAKWDVSASDCSLDGKTIVFDCAGLSAYDMGGNGNQNLLGNTLTIRNNGEVTADIILYGEHVKRTAYDSSWALYKDRPFHSGDYFHPALIGGNITYGGNTIAPKIAYEPDIDDIIQADPLTYGYDLHNLDWSVSDREPYGGHPEPSVYRIPFSASPTDITVPFDLKYSIEEPSLASGVVPSVVYDIQICMYAQQVD